MLVLVPKGVPCASVASTARVGQFRKAVGKSGNLLPKGTQIWNLCGRRNCTPAQSETPDMDVRWPHRQHACVPTRAAQLTVDQHYRELGERN